MAQLLVVAELVVHAACFFCGIITASSVKITEVEFGGRCMLYGSVGYNATSEEFSVSSSSNASLCLFVSIISGLISIYCFFVVLYCIYASCVGGVQRGSVGVTLSLALAASFLFFLLISGCILNIGLNSLCQSITTAKDLKSCQDAQSKNWSEPYKAYQFYTSLHNAEVSAWVNFFLWVVTLILLIVQRKRGAQYTQLSGAGDFERSTATQLSGAGDFERSTATQLSGAGDFERSIGVTDLIIPRLPRPRRWRRGGRGRRWRRWRR